MDDHVERIERNRAGEPPPPVPVEIRFTSTGGAEDVLERTRQVMRLVATAQVAEWPDDDEWRRRLPPWFLRSFEGHSLEEVLQDPLLWDFGSWLESMRSPGWQWWSCAAGDHGGVVRCVADEYPYLLGALLYLLRAAGADVVREEA